MQRQEQSFPRAAIERSHDTILCGCSDSQCQCDRFGGVGGGGGGRMLMTTIEVQKKLRGPARPQNNFIVEAQARPEPAGPRPGHWPDHIGPKNGNIIIMYTFIYD